MSKQYAASGFGVLPDQERSMGCRLQSDGAVFEILASQTAVRVPLSSFRFALGGLDNRMVRAKAEHQGRTIDLFIEDREIVKDLLQLPLDGRVRTSLDDLQREMSVQLGKRWGWRFAILAAILILFAGGYVGLRIVAIHVAENVPSDWQAELGRLGAQSIMEGKSVCADGKMNATVNEIGKRLVDAVGETPFPFHFAVIDDGQINAFALPGGFVFINRGLLEAADTADEVAGVVGHEITHALKSHGVRNIVTQMGIALALQILIGDAGEFQQMVLQQVGLLGGHSYSREQEFEADRGGMELVRKAGYSPQGMVAFFRKLEKEEGKMMKMMAIVSTHPATEDRIEKLKEMFPADHPDRLAEAAENWPDFKGICSPQSYTPPKKETEETPSE